MSIADEEMDAVTHIPPKPRPGSTPYFNPRPDGMNLPADPLATARRAGAALLMLGVVALLLGLFLTVSPVNSSQPFVGEVQLINAAGILVAGSASIVFGFIVPKGQQWTLLSALVLSLLICVYVVGVAVAEVRHTKSVLDPILFCLAALLGALAVVIHWLWQAMVIAPRLAAYRRRHGQAPSTAGRPAP